MPVCPVCRSQNMETAKFCGNCGNPFPRTSETTSSLRKCEQGHIYSAVYQACPYCPQGAEMRHESSTFETRIEEVPSFVDVTARPAQAQTHDFATRIDAPPLPNWPSTPSIPAMGESDLATRLETPTPSEFVTRIEAAPDEMLTRIEEPISAPTYDLLAGMNEKTPPVPTPATPIPTPAALPRTEILTEDSTLSARLDLPHPVAPAPAPIPPSVLDLDWPTPPPISAPSAPVPSAPLPLPLTSNEQEAAPASPPVTPAAPVAPSPRPSFANIPTGGPNRSTMVMSADDLKKSLSSKGKLVGWLVAYNRNPDGEDFKLYNGYNRLGANPACDIVIEDDTVSGSHAIIVYRDGRFLIKDDLSRNGTYVNGKEITEAHPLQNYDQIRVGNTTLVFVSAQKL